MLICGEVADKNKVLRLRFVTPADGSEQTPTVSMETGTSPDFRQRSGRSAGRTGRRHDHAVYDRSGEVLAALIAPLVAKLKPLAGNPPAGSRMRRVRNSGMPMQPESSALARSAGRMRAWRQLSHFTRETLSVRTRERVPLDWAETQNNLGNALSRLGERESGQRGLRRQLCPSATR